MLPYLYNTANYRHLQNIAKYDGCHGMNVCGGKYFLQKVLYDNE
jgi:hypothetical protein